jgi:hypothetical protein
VLINENYAGPKPIGAIALVDLTKEPIPGAVVTSKTIVVTRAAPIDDLREELQRTVNRRPASKFGVCGPIVVTTPSRLMNAISRKRLYLYTDGHFWRTEGLRSVQDALGTVFLERPSRHVPLMSNLRIREQDFSSLLD